eukprot:11213394-Lingulodinium_polyedra.AAC.1
MGPRRLPQGGHAHRGVLRVRPQQRRVPPSRHRDRVVQGPADSGGAGGPGGPSAVGPALAATPSDPHGQVRLGRQSDPRCQAG